MRFENQYYVFDHINAVRAFINNPDKYLEAIRDRALRNPEYIHLLRLQRWFPNASIAKLLRSLGMINCLNNLFLSINYAFNERH